MIGTRPTKDVRLMMPKAIADGFGKSHSDVLNICARTVLTPRYGSKRVRNIQEKMGVREV